MEQTSTNTEQSPPKSIGKGTSNPQDGSSVECTVNYLEINVFVIIVIGIMTLTKFTVLRKPLVKERTKKRPVVHLMGIPPMPNGYLKKSTTAITPALHELPQV